MQGQLVERLRQRRFRAARLVDYPMQTAREIINRILFIHKLEMRRQSRLDGEALQYRLAERVQRHDFKPARRIEYTRKEAACLLFDLRRWRGADQVRQFFL